MHRRLLCLILLQLTTGTALSQEENQEQEVFRFGVEVRTVYADVFVTRDGQPVTGLTAPDFELYDNGVRQTIQLVDIDTVPLSVMLILDTSGSVSGQALEHLRAAAHAFVDGLEEKDEAALMIFAREMSLRQAFTHSWEDLHRAIDGPIRGGDTSVKDAFYTGLKLVEGRPGRPLILLFTDGLDNTSWLTQSEVLEVARASESIVYAVGVKPRHSIIWTNSGREQRRMDGDAGSFLKTITSNTGGTVSYTESTAELQRLFVSILEEMKTRYLLSYQVEGALQEGWHDLRINVIGDKADDVRARAGYTVSPTQD
jgi:Ca-activated chloride channel family protein